MNIQYTEIKNAPTITFVSGNVTRFIDARTLALGVGKREEVTVRAFLRLIRKTIRTAREQELTAVNVPVSQLSFPNIAGISDETLGRLAAENTLLANYEFDYYKTKEEGGYAGIKTIAFLGATPAFKKGAEFGEIVAHEINNCRNLANMPGGDMTPTVLAKSAQKAAQGTSVKVTVLDKKDVAKLKMGLMLGVDQGSSEPMKFIIMEYWGAGKTSKQKPIVLVGKGITFDTGGINLKSSDHILGMHHDMTGGATAIAAICATAKLQLKKNVVALIPAVENAISGEAYRPGDVLTSMSGKTVEVLNTDAEGRLILADALTYAKRYTPRLIVDIATLTGAALVALGTHASALLTRDEKLERIMRDLGEISGDYVWPLPLWDEYAEYVKGQVADFSNIPRDQSRLGGAINGGTFLAQFVEKNQPWAHLDIAPRMEAVKQDYLAKGATGEPVRLLVRLIEEF